ncbi:MAG: N-succinylarginine dihydrolase [Desulfobacterales bacterium]|nr:N-succinylarginine dihydrolase [Desulfobacterales bacterium]
MKSFEVNFDGLVGPTHNYSGLSYGNVASLENVKNDSNPKEAAKQGLLKMKALSDMGLKQGVLPPHERPCVETLRTLGFNGSDKKVIMKASEQVPEIYSAVCSASCMWTANAATVSPASDTKDNKVHFTPANLSNKFHRSIEYKTTSRVLKSIFKKENFFTHHDALPQGNHFGDEGAANHTRLCSQYEDKGVEIFVFGKYAFDGSKPYPKKFPARQTFEASRSVAMIHKLRDDVPVFVQQNPDVIDSGVFHNDVICVGNRNVLFFHENAFYDSENALNEIRNSYSGDDLHFIEVKNVEVPVEDCVKSYLFNSQLISLDDNEMVLVTPTECEETDSVKEYLAKLVEMDNPIQSVKSFDLRQSMRNGGGPACLRFRVVLSQDEFWATNQKTIMNNNLYNSLDNWIEKHYRDRMSFDDLKDPEIVTEIRGALDELTQIMCLGSVYPFQK